jgi:hypothetical protein
MADFHYQNVGVANLHRAHFSEHIEAEAAPFPFFGRVDKSASDRVPMNVAQLLDSLLLSPDIEIIEASLPEVPRRNCGG